MDKLKALHQQLLASGAIKTADYGAWSAKLKSNPKGAYQWLTTSGAISDSEDDFNSWLGTPKKVKSAPKTATETPIQEVVQPIAPTTQKVTQPEPIKPALPPILEGFKYEPTSYQKDYESVQKMRKKGDLVNMEMPKSPLYPEVSTEYSNAVRQSDFFKRREEERKEIPTLAKRLGKKPQELEQEFAKGENDLYELSKEVAKATGNDLETVYEDLKKNPNWQLVGQYASVKKKNPEELAKSISRYTQHVKEGERIKTNTHIAKNYERVALQEGQSWLNTFDYNEARKQAKWIKNAPLTKEDNEVLSIYNFPSDDSKPDYEIGNLKHNVNDVYVKGAIDYFKKRQQGLSPEEAMTPELLAEMRIANPTFRLNEADKTDQEMYGTTTIDERKAAWSERNKRNKTAKSFLENPLILSDPKTDALLRDVPSTGMSSQDRTFLDQFETPKEKLDAYYNVLMSRLIRVQGEVAENSEQAFTREGTFGSQISKNPFDRTVDETLENITASIVQNMSIGGLSALSPQQREYLSLLKELKTLTPMVVSGTLPQNSKAFRNENGVIDWLNQFGLAAEGGFSRVTGANNAGMSRGNAAIETLNGLQNAGVLKNLSPEAMGRVKAKIENKGGFFGDEYIVNPELGEMAGSSAAFLLPFIATRKFVKLPALRASGVLVEGENLSKVGKVANALVGSLEAGLQYEVAGKVFSSGTQSEEMNFGTGLIGGAGRHLFGAVAPAFTRALGRLNPMRLTSVGRGMLQSEIGIVASQMAANSVDKGGKEIIEETLQSGWQAYEKGTFAEDMKAQFGTWNKALGFLVSVVTMAHLDGFSQDANQQWLDIAEDVARQNGVEVTAQDRKTAEEYAKGLVESGQVIETGRTEDTVTFGYMGGNYTVSKDGKIINAIDPKRDEPISTQQIKDAAAALFAPAEEVVQEGVPDTNVGNIEKPVVETTESLIPPKSGELETAQEKPVENLTPITKASEVQVGDVVQDINGKKGTVTAITNGVIEMDMGEGVTATANPKVVELFKPEITQTTAEEVAPVVEETTTEEPIGEELDEIGAKPEKTIEEFSNEDEFYRVVVGDEAFNDIVESGVVRTNADNKGITNTEGTINLGGRPTAAPSFSKGKASASYANDNPNNYIIVTNDKSIKPSTSGRHGKGTTMFPTDENGKPLRELDARNVSVYRHVGEGKYELVYDKGKLVEKAEKPVEQKVEVKPVSEEPVEQKTEAPIQEKTEKPIEIKPVEEKPVEKPKKPIEQFDKVTHNGKNYEYVGLKNTGEAYIYDPETGEGITVPAESLGIEKPVEKKTEKMPEVERTEKIDELEGDDADNAIINRVIDPLDGKNVAKLVADLGKVIEGRSVEKSLSFEERVREKLRNKLNSKEGQSLLDKAEKTGIDSVAEGIELDLAQEDGKEDIDYRGDAVGIVGDFLNTHKKGTLAESRISANAEKQVDSILERAKARYKELTGKAYKKPQEGYKENGDYVLPTGEVVSITDPRHPDYMPFQKGDFTPAPNIFRKVAERLFSKAFGGKNVELVTDPTEIAEEIAAWREYGMTDPTVGNAWVSPFIRIGNELVPGVREGEVRVVIRNAQESTYGHELGHVLFEGLRFTPEGQAMIDEMKKGNPYLDWSKGAYDGEETQLQEAFMEFVGDIVSMRLYEGMSKEEQVAATIDYFKKSAAEKFDKSIEEEKIRLEKKYGEKGKAAQIGKWLEQKAAVVKAAAASAREFMKAFNGWETMINEKFGKMDFLTSPISDLANQLADDIMAEKPEPKQSNIFSDMISKVPQFQISMPDGSRREATRGDTEVARGFYSPLEKIINEAKQDKLPAKQWLDKFANGEEAKWTGLRDWLNKQQGSVSKSDIQQFLKENRVEILEIGKEADDTKFSDYQLEGKKTNYKEVLVVLPRRKIGEKAVFNKYDHRDLITYLTGVNSRVSDDRIQDEGNKLSKLSKEQLLEKAKKRYESDDSDYAKEGFDDAVSAINKLKTEDIVEGGKFNSSHFDEPNILVHLRMNTRTDSEGNKVLFLEEVQSDWGQEGKKEGFNKTQAAPFVTDTSAWTKLGLKVALKEAIKQGIDKIAWTTGEQQNERYGLPLEGKGMKGFYGSVIDNNLGIVGSVAKSLTKQEPTMIKIEGNAQPSITITPELRTQVSVGQPQFQMGKNVETDINKVVESYYDLQEARGDKKRELNKERQKMLDEINPDIKRIFENIRSINKELVDKGIIEKIGNCP